MPSIRSGARGARYRPFLEQLESRLVTASVQPTALEQVFLERVNDARADPASVGVNVAPVQPFAFDGRVKALTPFITPARIEHMGDATVNALKARLRAGGPRFLEPHSITIEAGGGYPGLPVLCLPNECFFPGPTEKVDLLVSSLFKLEGGDIPLLSVYARGRGRLRDHRVIGLSLNGDTGAFSFLTLAPAEPSPILTGSVFRDANGNGKYDAGEGLAGVTITVNGQPSVLDYDSGGYTIPLKKAGLEQVTASGGGLPAPITQTVMATRGHNVRLNFIVS
jgi:hypothetical protein